MKNNNNFLYIIICLLFLDACTQPQNNGDFGDGLVSHFTFNKEGVDLLQSNIQIINHGSSLGENRVGEEGNSFKFDGTSSYSEITHNQAFEFEDNNFSISIWLKHPAAFNEGTSQFVFIKSTSTVAPVEGLALIVDYPKKGLISFRIDSDELLVSKSSYLDNNQWQHYVCVKDGDMLKIYLNGKLDNSLKIKKLTKATNNAPFIFGADHIKKQNNFEGNIDDFRVYKRPLEAKQVMALYEYESKKAIN